MRRLQLGWLLVSLLCFLPSPLLAQPPPKSGIGGPPPGGMERGDALQRPPQAVTRVAGGIDTYEVSRDGQFLYYLVHVDKIEDDWSGLRSKYSKLDYGHGQNRHGQIWK